LESTGSPVQFSLGGVATRGGRSVLFASCAQDFIVGDRNNAEDYFVKTRGERLDASLVSSSAPRLVGRSDFGSSQVVAARDRVDDVDAALTSQGANIRELRLVYRPTHKDLYGVIELQRMPPVVAGSLLPSPLTHAMRLKVGGVTYEVRTGVGAAPATFALFDCSTVVCSRESSLRGGYGTTGHRIVFSLPLGVVGADDGGTISEVEAFSTLEPGPGPARTIDRVRLAG
jgi:hypothetical protein